MTLLSNWLRAKEISLNTAKTKVIVFRSIAKSINKKLNFRLDGQNLIPVKSVLYLGLISDEHLNWSEYFNELLPKLAYYPNLDTMLIITLSSLIIMHSSILMSATACKPGAISKLSF